VNNVWKGIASALCRRRFVQLRNFHGFQSKDCFSTFVNRTDIPWSSALLYGCRSNVWVNREFVAYFGLMVHKLVIVNCSCEISVTEILQGMPNISQLEIYFPKKKTNATAGFQLDLPNAFVHLPLLTHLKTTAHALDFLDVLSRNCQIRLESIDIYKSFEQPTQGELNQLVSFLAPIPNISLWMDDLHWETEFTIFTTAQLRLKKLWLHFIEPSLESERQGFYGKMETFLGNCAELEELFVFCNHKRNKLPRFGNDGTRLTLPFLPALKRVTIDQNRDIPRWACGPYTFLTPFTTDQFPVLLKLSLLHFHEKRPDYSSIFVSCQLNSVSHVHLDEYMPDDLFRIFPGLRRLETRSLTSNGLLNLYNNARNLIHITHLRFPKSRLIVVTPISLMPKPIHVNSLRMVTEMESIMNECLPPFSPQAWFQN